MIAVSINDGITQSSRQGITLVEMTVVIAISAVISGIAVTTMASLLRASDATDRHVAERGELQRLAAALRKDIHKAIDCEWNAEGKNLRFQLLERQSIVYRLLEDRWVRVASRAGKTPVTTAYGLAGQFDCQCVPPKARQGELVRAQFSNEASQPPDGMNELRPRLQCEVVAIVGRDREMFHD